MDALLTVKELADEWMVGRREVVRHQLFERCIDAQHACQLFASIFEAVLNGYGEEHASQFAKAFAAH